MAIDVRMPTELRHIYRALLRATTYLPDTVAREYMHGQVVYRFRQVSRKIDLRARKGIRSDDLIRRYHGAKNIAVTRRAAKRLELAGQGSERDLKKVLHLTYGREGRRKRRLIEKLVDVNEHTLVPNEMALEDFIKQEAERQKQPRFHPDSKVMAILKSQVANRPVEITQPLIRRLSPKIPDENIWGRPTPMKLRKSLTKRHWVDVLDKILPPLPEHEWNRLRDLATGVIPCEKPIPRRSQHGRIAATGDSNDEKVLKYFTVAPHLHNSEFDEVKVDAEKGATVWAPPIPKAERPDSRYPTQSQRYLRRLYASIWNITPTTSLNPETNKWVVKWGGMRSRAHEGHFTKPGVKDMEFWEGLDEPKSKQQASRP